MRKVFISDIPIISCVSTEFYRVVLTIQKLLGHSLFNDDEYDDVWSLFNVQVTSAMFLVLEAKLAVSKIWDMWTESHNTDG